MKNLKLWIGLAAVAALAGGWYLFRPERLFINQTVNESLETASVPARDGMTMTAESEGKVEVLKTGTFHSGSHPTEGTATIHRLADGRRVLRLTGFSTSNGPDVQLYLVAADDATDNETVTKAGFVNVAALKGNQGDQNYDLPADLDLEKYRAVTIWCRRFSVNFGTAPLRSPDGVSTMKEWEQTSSAVVTGAMSATTEAPAMPAGLRPLASGRFHDGAHATHGTATVFQLPDGRRVLRLTDFETSNGPDVQVYLVAADDATDNATVTQAGFVRVAALKGNRGDQNYDLPADVDLAKYRAVTIWCRRFSVNFGTAPLQTQPS